MQIILEILLFYAEVEFQSLLNISFTRASSKFAWMKHAPINNGYLIIAPIG